VQIYVLVVDAKTDVAVQSPKAPFRNCIPSL